MLALVCVVFRETAGTRGENGKALDDFVEQIANALAVLSGDLEHRLEAELMKLDDSGAGPAVVSLVHGNHGRLVCRAHDLCDVVIAWDEPFTAIHNQHKEYGVS